MKETAVILADNGRASTSDAIVRLLRFLGVPSRVVSVAEFLQSAGAGPRPSEPFRLFSPAPTFLRLLEEWERRNGETALWREYVHSVFVYSGGDAAALQNLAGRMKGGSPAPLVRLDPGAGEWVLTNKHPEFCGVMSGLRVPVRGAAVGAIAAVDGSEGNASGGQRTVFARFDHHAVPVFLSAGPEIIDVGAELTTPNFDIRDYFLAAAPVVLYAKWACAGQCWKAPETSASLIIDDPLLWPRYGFLNYEGLLRLMQRHNFSTTIAFIPWNWRRSRTKVAGLFRDHPDRYSLAIHGCDHTRAEFGSQEVDRLRCKAHQALERMSRHESKTGIHHGRVIVFPQGIFSAAAPGILKRAPFVAAVNTEVFSSDTNPPRLTIADVWNVAVMNYADFPIFSRRYQSQGVENLAFDILLGKACLVVTHHDGCRGQGVPLAEFIERLNALNGRLVWRGLGEAVRHSYRQRELSPGLVEAEMYASELRVMNPSDGPKRFRITKRESDASAVREIRMGGGQIPWSFSEGRICFEVELPARESALVAIAYQELPATPPYREGITSRLKTAARRYLCEVRDNYIHTYLR